MAVAEFDAEAQGLVDAEIARFRGFSFEAARELPECDDVDLLIGGQNASMTTFRYLSPFGLEGCVLVVVLAALPRFLGMTARHIEKGLVFSAERPPRDATRTELENSGG
jgi:hypothetical protein